MTAPRKHEDSLHIEDHEQHRHEIVPDAVPVTRIGFGLDAALVRFEFDLVVTFGTNQAGQSQREDREADRDERKDENRDVSFEHAGEL